jgi:WD40 repeat protein
MKILYLLVLIFGPIFWINSEAQTRLVIDPQAHFGVVNDLVFTSSGKYLISVSDDKTIRIWDVEKKQLDRTLRTFSGEGAEGAIYALAISPDDRFLAIGGYFNENEIRIIDFKKSSDVIVLKGHTNVVTSIEFSKDGRQMASSDVTGIIKLWDINYANGQMIGEAKLDLEGHKAQVYDLSFSPDGKQLVSASYDGSLQLWDLAGVKKPVVMRMHIDKVYSCAFSSDGKWIVSGGNKGKVIIWDNRGAFSRYLSSLSEPINDIVIVGDNIIISTSQGYHYSFSNTSDLKMLPVPFSKISASTISSKKLAALAGGANGDIIVYDLNTNDPVHLFRNKSILPKKIGISNDASIVFDLDGKGFTKGVNLSNLSYLWEVNVKTNYFTEKHEENGYKLSAIDKFTLSTGFKGKVEMNPRVDGRLRSFTIIDEETIAVGGDFSLKLYSKEGVFKGELKGFNGAITSIASSNNRITASCSDQTVRVWNSTTLELLTSIFLAPKGEWICWTPQGYYEASSGGEKYIGWQVDEDNTKMSKFYKSSVFASKFHQTNLVRQTLALGGFEIAKKKVANEVKEETPLVKEVTEAGIIVKTAPSIEWITPEFIASEQNQGNITIKALIKSQSKIDKIKILVNGRPSSNSRGVAIPKTVGEFDILVEQEIVLSNDINEIRIFVSNQEAKGVSEKRVINLIGVDNRGEGRSLEVINYSDRPDLYILSIGVSDYANSSYNLNYAHNDAKSVADVFENLGTQVYKDINSTRLLNSEADKKSILGAFDNLTKKVKPKDMVLIFIASHGINKDGEFFILPHDADLLQKPGNVVSWKDLTKTLSELPSNVIVMIDACRSGQLGVNLTKFGANNTEALRNASSDENGLVLMAAATGNESALETPAWEHGAFTLALLEGLENGKADIKPDGTIYLRELDFYISERTIELTNNAQHPTTQKPSTISRLTIINLNK